MRYIRHALRGWHTDRLSFDPPPSAFLRPFPRLRNGHFRAWGHLFPKRSSIMTAQRTLAVTLGLLLVLPGLAKAQYNFTPIDAPGGSNTAVNGNSANAIAGQFDDADGNTHGFVLDVDGFTPIDVPGATLTSANGLNATGQQA